MQKEDVLKDCIAYFGGEVMPAGVWIDKYALHDGDEILERTPDDMHRRIAREFARIESKFKGDNMLSENEIYELLKDFKYIVPGGSVMSGLGNKNYRGSLSNCFVIEGPKDSYASIDRSRERMTSIFKMRGGVGLDLSNPRPSGAKVSNAAGESTGPVSFMAGYSQKVREVAQAGRRGALMISFSCLHPDIEEFIESKQDQGEITGANISVRFTDDFMLAVKNNEEFLLRFPIDTDVTGINLEKYPLNEKVFEGKRCFKKVNARDVWNKFVHCAWNTAEPGLMFSDTQVEYSPDGVYPEYRGVTTNPCGEIFMQPFDSCRLLHLNYMSFVEDGKFNYDRFQDVCKKAIRLADDLVELELEAVDRIIEHIKEDLLPEEEDELAMWEKIRETGRRSRRIGVGGTALADACALAGVRLCDPEGIEFTESIAKAMFEAEMEEEVQLAKERGSFTGWDFEKEFKIHQQIDALGVIENIVPLNEFYENMLYEISDELLQDYRKYGRRNVSWSTMAPTGTVSLMTQTSSGIEPLFMCYNFRKRKCTKSTDRVDYVDPSTGDKFTVYNMVHKPFKDWVIKNIYDYDHSKSFEEQATQEKIKEWYEKSPWFGSLAADITPEHHVMIQAIFQKYITASISKTCNLPKEATEEDISKIYMSAWEYSCKGCTVFREGSRPAILGKIEDEKKDGEVELLHPAPARPEELPCVIKRFNNHKEKWVACIGLYKDRNGYHPYEIFTGLAEKLDIPAGVEEGKIVKVKVKDEESGKKVSQFNLVYYLDGKEHTVYAINRVFNREFYNWAIALSGFLRQGMGVEYVIKQLDKFVFDEELSINSWRNGVKIALKKYIKDGDINGDRCPMCGGPIRRENGCVICLNPDCKWTACSN